VRTPEATSAIAHAVTNVAMLRLIEPKKVIEKPEAVVMAVAIAALAIKIKAKTATLEQVLEMPSLSASRRIALLEIATLAPKIAPPTGLIIEKTVPAS
jgi:hypothetical protein